MDKKRGIELLIQAVDEIPHLKTLHYRDGEIKLWLDKVENILREGLKPDDYNKYWPVSPRIEILKGIYEDNIYQEEYLRKITDYELALKSILLKYELLGFEPKPDIEEPPKATKDYEKKAATKELELPLEGTPDMILECIRSTIEKLNSQGYTYSLRRTSGAPDYARWDKTYFASCAISQGDEGQIGTIKLQLLPNERTLFKIPEPKDWDSSFGEFIKHLLAEFKRLGFLYFKEEKPPIGFPLPHREKNV